MKILLVAPFLPNSLGESCLKAMQSLGHEVLSFDCRAKIRDTRTLWTVLKREGGIQRMNKAFVNYVAQERPEVILVFKGESLLPESLSEVKRRFSPFMAVWHPDNPCNLFCSSTYLIYSITVYDLVMLFDPYYLPGVRQMGAKAADYLPLCAAAEPTGALTMTAEDRARFEANITFVGHAAGYNSIRRKTLSHISDMGLAIWGKYWTSQSTADMAYGYWGDTRDPALGRCVRGLIMGPDMLKAYACSKIGVNVLCDQSVEGLNARSFEIPSSGTFTLTNDIRMLKEHFRLGEDVVVYKDLADLRDKITYYLKHDDERRQIAENGRKRYLKDHAIAKRMQQMLDMVSHYRSKSQTSG